MEITAVCITYNRPALLGRLIACFERQTHPECNLLILDSASQYGERQGKVRGKRLLSWKIIPCPCYETMAERTNACVKEAHTEAIAIWDDDDVYLPWALSSCVSALSIHPWAQPRIVYEHRVGGLAKMITERSCGGYGYHAGWAYRKPAFHRAGGYVPRDAGSDLVFSRAMNGICGTSIDANSSGDPYIIVGHNTRNRGEPLWPLGEKDYIRAKPGDENPVLQNPEIPIEWQVDYTSLPIVEEIADLREW